MGGEHTKQMNVTPQTQVHIQSPVCAWVKVNAVSEVTDEHYLLSQNTVCQGINLWEAPRT